MITQGDIYTRFFLFFFLNKIFGLSSMSKFQKVVNKFEVKVNVQKGRPKILLIYVFIHCYCYLSINDVSSRIILLWVTLYRWEMVQQLSHWKVKGHCTGKKGLFTSWYIFCACSGGIYHIKLKTSVYISIYIYRRVQFLA